MKFLVTGCRGFIGESVGRFAAQAGHEVLGVARSSQPVLGWPGEYVQADVLHTDLSAVIRDFSPDAVLHAAGTASVGASLNAPLEDLRAAVLTWANILESVRRSGTWPLILFPSSAAVYGNPAHLPVAEDAPVAPVSPYGFHKAACELIAREYAECYDLNITIFRLFSVFGLIQRRLLVWEIFQQLTSSEDTVWLRGTGQETRDYLHIEDVAQGMLSIADTTGSHDRPPSALDVINLASGEETPIFELAQMMRDIIAPAKEIRCAGEERPGDPVRWCADISGLRRRIPGWNPFYLKEALAACCAEWQNTMSIAQ